MSEVRRYEFDENGVCYHQPDGPFVSYDDYARLKAEVERLNVQVERLIKAGDIIANRLMYQGYHLTIPQWNEAKDKYPRS